MQSKISIDSYPKNGEPDYNHLQPIVDFLLTKGNESANNYLWGNNRTGYFCHLRNDIDFDEIQERFDFPESIKINKEKQTIDCFNTYSVIKRATSD